jgi:hypothetical protein
MAGREECIAFECSAGYELMMASVILPPSAAILPSEIIKLKPTTAYRAIPVVASFKNCS